MGAPDDGGHQERVAFCVAQPVAALVEADVRLVTERLTRGVEGVFDLVDAEHGARLVSALVERADSEANSAELVPLGVSGDAAAHGPLLLRTIDQAVALARSGPREVLHVVVPPRFEVLGALLLERGFEIGFACSTMRTRDATFQAIDAPAGLRFADWHAGIAVEAVDDVVVRAFTGTPGFMRMPLDDLRERLGSSRPPARMLLAGTTLVGVSRLRAPGADGVGFVSLIARDPTWHGRGLGDALLSDALRVLAAAGAQRVALDVVTVNERALALYRRHGFEPVSVETTWRRQLHP